MARISRSTSNMDRSLGGASWKWCGTLCPSQEIVFFAQITLIFIVVIAAVVNLALGTGRAEYWAGTMSACLGYILPSPTMDLRRRTVTALETPVNDGRHFIYSTKKNTVTADEDCVDSKPLKNVGKL